MVLVGFALKKPSKGSDPDEVHVSTSKFCALMSKFTSVRGTATPTPEQTSKLVANEVIIGFLVMIISIESSASIHGAFPMAFKVNNTRPLALSAVPGW